MKKIAALAEAPSLGVFPHLMGSLVNAAASAQLDAASPNVVLQKGAHTATHHLNEIVDQLFTLEEGHTIVPGRPGIGIEVLEDRVSSSPHRPAPIRGSFRRDGSLAHQ